MSFFKGIKNVRILPVAIAMALTFLGFPAIANGSTTHGSATLAWERNSEPDVVGYKIYWGETTRLYTRVMSVGNTSGAVLGSLTAGQPYFCAVTAYNSAGQESSFSQEITVMVGAAPGSADTSGRLVLLEAESGQLGTPMSVFNGSAESWVDTASYSQLGWTKLTFDAPVTGDYHVWCRVKAPSASNDSFFVAMDGGTESVFHIYGTPTPPEGTRTSSWTWRRIHIPDAGPLAFSLEQTSHSLRFRVREPGTLLDRIVLTSDPAFVPSDALPRTGNALSVTGIPASQTRSTGASATFTVMAAATGPVSYQWAKDGVAIAGATAPSLTLSPIELSNRGIYSVALSCGTAKASAGPASLVVTEAALAPVFQVNRLTIHPDLSVSFDVEGELEANVLVYASSDLVNWTLIAGQVNETGSIHAADPAAVGKKKRFYRLVSEPAS